MEYLLFALVFLPITVAYLKDKTKEKPIEVMYGYPKYSKVWLTVKYYRRKDFWVFERDDLFDSGRPKSYGDLSQSLMYRCKDSNITEEEFLKAGRLLKERNYI